MDNIDNQLLKQETMILDTLTLPLKALRAYILQMYLFKIDPHRKS